MERGVQRGCPAGGVCEGCPLTIALYFPPPARRGIKGERWFNQGDTPWTLPLRQAQDKQEAAPPWTLPRNNSSLQDCPITCYGVWEEMSLNRVSTVLSEVNSMTLIEAVSHLRRRKCSKGRPNAALTMARMARLCDTAATVASG